MKCKHVLKITLMAIAVLIFMGALCYIDVSPVDVISGATANKDGLQDGGALTYFLEGSGR